MCAIAGIIRIGGSGVECARALAMSTAIKHRGPDDSGYVIIDKERRGYFEFSDDDSCARVRSTYPHIRSEFAKSRADGAAALLLHRRYSVIDLSDNGHQPLVSRGGRYLMVFNGEIYNYQELSEQLPGFDDGSKALSDSEVLLAAFESWGESCFSRFIGFWAVVIYDTHTGEVYLSRDRLGQKPLYWAVHDGSFYFASEIKAILEVSDSFRMENLDSTDGWLVGGVRDNSTSTFYKGISSFPAASYATLPNLLSGSPSKYWSIEKIERLRDDEIGVVECCQEFREIFDDAVSLRLRSDLQVGISLSGGLDSSAILAFAKRHCPEIKAVTTYFKEADETPFAKHVADYLDIDLEVISPDPDDFWDDIEEFVRLMEEPFHSPNLYVSMKNLSILRESGIGVVLNGSVGDEVFGGYQSFFLPSQVELISSMRWVRLLINSCQWTERNTGILRNLVRTYKYWRRTSSHRSAVSDLSKRCLLESPVPYWLSSGDKSDMGIPVEVRCPFVDHRVVEFGLKVPSTYLVRNGWHKWIVRKSLEGMLPKNVIWRKQKMGYPFPIEKTLQMKEAVLKGFIDGQPSRTRGAESHLDWKSVSYWLWRELFIQKRTDLFELLKSR